MPEIKHEVKTYEVNYKCDECGQGEMESTRKKDVGFEKTYGHKFNYCGEQKSFEYRYPNYRYEPFGPEIK